MSVSATEAVSATSGLYTTSPTTSTSSSDDKDLFMALLVAQLKYQDPMNPTDSTQYLSQTAEYSSLEKLSDLVDQSTSLLANQLSFGAAAMVGSNVSYVNSAGETVSGTVDSVGFASGSPVLVVGGVEVALGQVSSVGNGSTTTASSSDSSSSTTTA